MIKIELQIHLKLETDQYILEHSLLLLQNRMSLLFGALFRIHKNNVILFFQKDRILDKLDRKSKERMDFILKKILIL